MCTSLKSYLLRPLSCIVAIPQTPLKRITNVTVILLSSWLPHFRTYSSSKKQTHVVFFVERINQERMLQLLQDTLNAQCSHGYLLLLASSFGHGYIMVHLCSRVLPSSGGSDENSTQITAGLRQVTLLGAAALLRSGTAVHRALHGVFPVLVDQFSRTRVPTSLIISSHQLHNSKAHGNRAYEVFYVVPIQRVIIRHLRERPRRESNMIPDSILLYSQSSSKNNHHHESITQQLPGENTGPQPNTMQSWENPPDCGKEGL